MEQQSLFRKNSIERISSPEQLTDYLRVTTPTVWVVIAAIILLLVGILIWGATASIESYAAGTAQVEDGSLVLFFDDAQLAENVEAGMTVTVGETSSPISSVGRTEDGRLFAAAATTLADGSYPARVVFRQTQVLRLLFRGGSCHGANEDPTAGEQGQSQGPGRHADGGARVRGGLSRHGDGLLRQMGAAGAGAP